ELVLHVPRRIVAVCCPVLLQPDLVSAFDLRAPGRERLQQLRWYPGDLTHWPAAPPTFTLDELNAQPGPQLVLDPGVVRLAGADRHRMQHPHVQGTPRAVAPPNLRGHRDVGVQVGVTGARVRVVEHGSHQAIGVDLRDTRRAGPGPGAAEGPQYRRRLHWR